jgi:hypothetical protein
MKPNSGWGMPLGCHERTGTHRRIRAVIEPLLPPEPSKRKGGRPHVPDRNVLAGIVFMLPSSCS